MKYLPLISLTFPLLSLTANADPVERELRESTIVVTSPGPERPAGELIANVTVLGRDELVSDLAGTLGDTLDRQPGVATTYFGAGASRPVLRGLGAERVLVLTNGLGVIDASAASPDHQVTGDAIDAQKVEILRGPVAFAYGGQAIGGVVNVIDGLIVEDIPDEAVSGDLFVSGQSANDGLEASGKVQFSQGNLVLTLSASKRDFDDYDVPGFVESSAFRAAEEEDNDHDEDEDHDEDHDHEDEEEARDTVENSFLDTQTLSAGLSWVGESAYFGVAVRNTTSEYGLPGHSHDHEHEDEDHDEDHDEDYDDDHEEEGLPFIDMEQTRIDVKGGINLGDGAFRKLEAALSYSDYEHTEFEAPGEPGTVYESEGFESRVELDFVAGEFQGALGAQYTDKSIGAFGEEAFISPTDTTSFGIFAYNTREWESGFGIEGSLRLETVEHDNELFGASDFELLSGGFGLHQHWESGWFAGVQGSYSSRAPNESELFADGPHYATNQYEVGDQSLDVESALNIEATIRWEGDQSYLGASVFVTHFRDFIYLTPGETLHDGMLTDEVDELPVWLFTQQDADFQGFEIFGRHEFATPVLGASWAVEGNLDYVQADFNDGSNVPYLPPLTFNGALQADWGAFGAEVNTTVASEQDDPGVGVLPTDSYATLGVRADVELGEFMPAAQGVMFFVDARNITDEEIRYSTSVLKDQLPAPGRNFRLGVKASF